MGSMRKSRLVEYKQGRLQGHFVSGKRHDATALDDLLRNLYGDEKICERNHSNSIREKISFWI